MPFAISFTDIRAARTRPTRSEHALHPQAADIGVDSKPASTSGCRSSEGCSLLGLGACDSTLPAKPGSQTPAEELAVGSLSQPQGGTSPSTAQQAAPLLLPDSSTDLPAAHGAPSTHLCPPPRSPGSSPPPSAASPWLTPSELGRAREAVSWPQHPQAATQPCHQLPPHLPPSP